MSIQGRKHSDVLNKNLNEYSVDFKISMGKEDSYLRPFYNACLRKKAPDYWRKTVSQKSPLQVFNFFRDLYNKNKLNRLRKSETYRIPRVIHQIWIGPKPFPEKYKKWQKTWQSMPGWEYKLWTDKEVEQYTLINKDLYLKEKNIGARADILRMEILYREGGLYVDTDFECLQPKMFDVLNQSYDFYSGITPVDAEVILLANGLIGSIPGHPILEAYINNIRNVKTENDCDGIVMKGPGFFTNLVLTHANQKGLRDILFPPSFFYPLAIWPGRPKGALYDRQGALAHLMESEEGRDEIKRLVNKHESLAIHWWEGSWGIADDGKSLAC